MTDIKYDESKGSDKCTVTTDGGEVVRAMNVNSVSGEVIYDKSKGSVQSTVITEDGQTVRAMNVVNLGEGGGGGGDFDKSKVVNKAEVMPTADSSTAGQVYMYTGATNASYTHGYIYENTASLGLIGPAEDATQGDPGESMVFSLDATVFAAYLQSKGIVLSGQTAFYLEEDSDPDTGDNVYVLQDADGVSIEEFTSLVDMESATGITWGGQEDLTGDFPYVSENVTGFVVGSTYAWTRIDVQPGGGTTVTIITED